MRLCPYFQTLPQEIRENVVEETRVRDRDLVPRMCWSIASRPLHLRRAAWALYDDENGNPQRRRQIRQDLAAGLERLSSGSLGHFRLAFPITGPVNQAGEPPACNSDNTILDPLSMAVWTLSQKLKTVAIGGCLLGNAPENLSRLLNIWASEFYSFVINMRKF